MASPTGVEKQDGETRDLTTAAASACPGACCSSPFPEPSFRFLPVHAALLFWTIKSSSSAASRRSSCRRRASSAELFSLQHLPCLCALRPSFFSFDRFRDDVGAGQQAPVRRRTFSSSARLEQLDAREAQNLLAAGARRRMLSASSAAGSPTQPSSSSSSSSYGSRRPYRSPGPRRPSRRRPLRCHRLRTRRPPSRRFISPRPDLL